MSQIYEGMFLLDNDLVREGWDSAKGAVTATLEKHGGEVLTARRWDERRLAYPISGRRRATYLLVHYTLPAEAIPAMRRDLDLSERVLRYLFLAVDAVPEEERELAAAEGAADFSVPPPPPDDQPDVVEEPAAAPAAEAPSPGGDAASPQGDSAPQGAAEAAPVASAASAAPAAGETSAEPAAAAASTGDDETKEG